MDLPTIAGYSGYISGAFLILGILIAMIGAKKVLGWIFGILGIVGVAFGDIVMSIPDLATQINQMIVEAIPEAARYLVMLPQIASGALCLLFVLMLHVSKRGTKTLAFAGGLVLASKTVMVMAAGIFMVMGSEALLAVNMMSVLAGIFMIFYGFSVRKILD